MTIHILAAVAQKERELISARVKAALQVLKDKGIKLGCPEVTIKGRKRIDIILENRSKRVYDKPNASKVDILKVLYKSGQNIDQLQEAATHLFGRHLSKVTIYSYLKLFKIN